jgi:hypothetical protein
VPRSARIAGSPSWRVISQLATVILRPGWVSGTADDPQAVGLQRLHTALDGAGPTA